MGRYSRNTSKLYATKPRPFAGEAFCVQRDVERCGLVRLDVLIHQKFTRKRFPPVNKSVEEIGAVP